MSLLALVAHAQPAPSSQSNFKVVDNPGGGRYIYGPFTGKGSLPDAVIYMLRNIHDYFGYKPDVGKFFQSRDGTQVAAFFAVNAKSANDRPMSGLMIVSRASDGSASGAVVFDDRARFGSTEPALMKALYSVWQPAGGTSGGASVNGTAGAGSNGATHAPQKTGTAGPAALVEATGGDQSASISLPAGWHIKSVNSGSLNVVGANGEMVFLGIVYQGFALGPDLFSDFVNISNQFRGKNGMPPGAYTVLNKINVPGNAIQVAYKVDFNDGVGMRRGTVRLGLWGPQALSVDGSNVPERLAEEENATLLAVIHSYRQNSQMMAQLRQGALARVQADGARANAQSAAINARREANTAAYNQHMSGLDAQYSAYDAHMDNIDRSSKITFSIVRWWPITKMAIGGP